MKPLVGPSKRLFFTLKLVSLIAYSSHGQSISGYVRDENHNPVPFANIFVQETGGGAAADDRGKYYLTIDPGIYNLVISSIGFEPLKIQIIVGDKPIVRDFKIPSSTVKLDQIEISVRRRDPAIWTSSTALNCLMASMSAPTSGSATGGQLKVMTLPPSSTK